MKTDKFMTHAKKAGMTVAEVGVVGGSMLLTTKFLDFEILFKNQIEKDPEYKNKWFIKHQGAIKLVAGAAAAAYIKNPWLKLIAIGVAANGFIQEVRVLTAKEDGTNFFNQIGQSEMDKQLMEAAKGTGEYYRPGTTYVAAKGTESPTFVAKPVDLMQPWYTGTGRSMERGIGVGAMMERGVGCSMAM